MGINTIQEIWKDVVGYEGYYQVNNKGKVKTFRVGTKCNSGILNPFINNSGYQVVRLTDKDGKRKSFLVHRLVALMFITKSLDILNEVNHINGNKFDNNPTNLEWINHFDQMQHAHKNGLIDYSKRRGEKCWKAKLTNEQVKEIRSKHIPWKVSFTDLACEYHVSRGAIASIMGRKSWKDI